jgi:hypothetical protein
MSIGKTLDAYSQERLNCAQSIFRGFQDKASVSQETIDEARAFGGGRAYEGRCGALYAAMELTKSPRAKETLIDAFVRQAGSDKCREIKKLGKFKCIDCVRLAAEELARSIDEP